jgi:hypothetical protein
MGLLSPTEAMFAAISLKIRWLRTRGFITVMPLTGTISTS